MPQAKPKKTLSTVFARVYDMKRGDGQPVRVKVALTVDPDKLDALINKAHRRGGKTTLGGGLTFTVEDVK